MSKEQYDNELLGAVREYHMASVAYGDANAAKKEAQKKWEAAQQRVNEAKRRMDAIIATKPPVDD